MRIYHPVFGRGTVLRQRWLGTELLVRFETTGLTLWIKRKEVKILDGSQKVTLKTSPLKAEPISGGDHDSRRMIEAFRLGIVPKFAIKDFTFGRETEIKKFLQLKEEYYKLGGQVVLIEGEYGSGKTHFMDYMASVLYEEGFAVSEVELHPIAGTPSRPKQIYREIVTNFRVRLNDSNLGFIDFIKLALGVDLPHYHPILTPFFRHLRKTPYSPILLSYISGEPMDREYLNAVKKWRLPVLLDHTSAADIYTNLLTAFAYILKTMGSPGFAILLDEGEGVFFSYYYYYNRWIMALAFLRGFLFTALNKEEALTLENLRDTPMYPVGKQDTYGWVHSGVRPMPYAYMLPSNLFVVVAFTPLMRDEYLRLLQDIPSDKWIPLSNLNEKAYEKILDATIKLYERAYPGFTIDKGTRSKLSSKFLREYGKTDVRFFLENLINELDILRHYEG